MGFHFELDGVWPRVWSAYKLVWVTNMSQSSSSTIRENTPRGVSSTAIGCFGPGFWVNCLGFRGMYPSVVQSTWNPAKSSSSSSSPSTQNSHSWARSKGSSGTKPYTSTSLSNSPLSPNSTSLPSLSQYSLLAIFARDFLFIFLFIGLRFYLIDVIVGQRRHLGGHVVFKDQQDPPHVYLNQWQCILCCMLQENDDISTMLRYAAAGRRLKAALRSNRREMQCCAAQHPARMG